MTTTLDDTQLKALLRVEFEFDQPSPCRPVLINYVAHHPSCWSFLKPQLPMVQALLPHWLPLPRELAELMGDYLPVCCAGCGVTVLNLNLCAHCHEYRCQLCCRLIDDAFYCKSHQLEKCHACHQVVEFSLIHVCFVCDQLCCQTCRQGTGCIFCEHQRCRTCREETAVTTCCGQHVCRYHTRRLIEHCDQCHRRPCCHQVGFAWCVRADKWRLLCAPCQLSSDASSSSISTQANMSSNLSRF